MSGVNFPGHDPTSPRFAWVGMVLDHGAHEEQGPCGQAFRQHTRPEGHAGDGATSPRSGSTGGVGFYFEDPNGHLLELITKPYGSLSS